MLNNLIKKASKSIHFQHHQYLFLFLYKKINNDIRSGLELDRFLRGRGGSWSSLVTETHLAVALKDGAFLDDELLGLDVANVLGAAFEDELLGNIDVALDTAGNHCSDALDFTFDVAGLLNDEFAFDVDAAVDVTGDAHVALAADIALDVDGATDLGDFLFALYSHGISPLVINSV